ncbi:MAG: T9SS type A sorting domain-containing protein, partial [Candidatus Pacearchaeota archaeon]|nr:T9SS type A sorting domain-containing protein [Candidatus Pacearchaeota archaeon]
GQTARTFRIVTPTGNRIVTLFPGGHNFMVNKIFDTVDSANVKCYSKGAVWSDTLIQRFDIGLPSDNIYFNREKFSRKPALNDSIIFEITEGSYYGRTACQYKRALWDADSAPSCSLRLVGVNENLESKLDEPRSLIIRPNPAKNYIVFNQEVKGFLYDATGKKIMSLDSDKLDLKKINIPSGVYFIKDDKKKLGGKVTVIR